MPTHSRMPMPKLTRRVPLVRGWWLGVCVVAGCGFALERGEEGLLAPHLTNISTHATLAIHTDDRALRQALTKTVRAAGITLAPTTTPAAAPPPTPRAETWHLTITQSDFHRRTHSFVAGTAHQYQYQYRVHYHLTDPTGTHLMRDPINQFRTLTYVAGEELAMTRAEKFLRTEMTQEIVQEITQGIAQVITQTLARQHHPRVAPPAR